MAPATYLGRLADRYIEDLVSELPALMLIGPRATGKSTTAQRHAATVLQLDRPAVATAVRADPDAVLRDLPTPILLDEWQAVPEVLGAVKRAVDAKPSPGRFILAGSVRARSTGDSWPGTGRVVPVPLAGLSIREIEQQLGGATLVDRILEDGPAALTSPPSAPDIRGYVELALTSGFPEPALNLSERARRAWLGGYIDQVVHRDAQEIVDTPRDPQRLLRFMQGLASNSAGTATDVTLATAAGVDRRTAAAYDKLLEDLLLIEKVPAWSTQRLERLVRSPKRYLTDPALITTLLGDMDVNGVMTDGDILGRLLDTFVYAQLRAEMPFGRNSARAHHLRQDDGRREVDLVIETSGQRIIGIEVKATAAPTQQAARHLAWLRDTMGERFVAGLLLHTGPRVLVLGERIVAAPIACLWT